MVKVISEILFLAGLITIGSCQLPKSPCPKYFQYYQDEITGEVLGIIAIPSPIPKGIALMLRLTLHFPTAVSSNYNGTMELIKSKTDYAPVQQAIDEGRPLLFRVRFPSQQLLPIVKQIVFNNRPNCIGPKVSWPIYTTVDLEKILYPPGLISRLVDKSYLINNTKLHGIPSSEDNSGLTSSDSSILELNETCGISGNANLSIDIRFGDEEKVYPGKWPWLAAIFINLKIDSEDEFQYRCIGNLISSKHIITAAHCLKENGEDIPLNALSVSLGKYNIELSNETESLKLDISEIRFHPKFNISFTNADSDLAIIVLKNPVKYSSKILPICLWKDSIDLEKIVGEKGTVVGWRKYGKRYKGEPRKTIQRIVSQEDCLRSNPAFIEITSNRTFCAGNRNGNGPCNGDSGSGFVIQDTKTKRYYLRGIVSLTLFDKKVMSCDLTHYVVYLDIAKHLAWINEQISIDQRSTDLTEIRHSHFL